MSYRCQKGVNLANKSNSGGAVFYSPPTPPFWCPQGVGISHTQGLGTCLNEW